MAFNPDTKKKIVRDSRTKKHHPCRMCGTTFPCPDAVHIIDEKEWKAKHGGDRQVNGIPLCPNCHRVFDEFLRPYFYRALEAFGSTNLPESWKKSNKITASGDTIDE
jgi:predicted restriction endonuclease